MGEKGHAFLADSFGGKDLDDPLFHNKDIVTRRDNTQNRQWYQNHNLDLKKQLVSTANLHKQPLFSESNEERRIYQELKKK